MFVVSKDSKVADEWACLREYQASIVARATGDLSRGSKQLELRQRIVVPEQTADVQSQTKSVWVKKKRCVYIFSLAFITESRNHKITDWFKLEGSSGDTQVQLPCTDRDTLSHLPMTMPREFFSISKEGDSTTSPNNLYQFSVILMVTRVFPDVQREPLGFPIVPAGSARVTGYHWKGPVLHAPSLQIFVCMDGIPLIFLCSKLNSPSSLSLYSHTRCPSPLIV